MYDRIEQIVRRIDELREEEKSFVRQIDMLGNVKLTNDVKEMVVKALFDIEKQERLDSEDLSTYKKNRIELFNIDMNGELTQKGHNLWGMFSAVTKYTTHTMKQGRDNTENKMFGTIGKKEREIWEKLVELV